MTEPPSYHDLHITTARIPRAKISNLPFGLEVSCNRVAGWCLWDTVDTLGGPAEHRLLAGEYEGPEQWLVLDVAGHVIVDSRQKGRPEQAPA